VHTLRCRVVRPAPAATFALTVALVLAACGSDTPEPADDLAARSIGPIPTLLPRAADDPASPLGSPAGSTGGSPAAPAATDDLLAEWLHGKFRRAGVPVSPGLEAEAADACRAVPQPAYVEEIGSRPVVVTDMRGMGVILVEFGDAQGATGCRVEIGDDGSMRASFLHLNEDPSVALEEGAVSLGAMDYVDDGIRQRAIAVGRAGARVWKVRAGFDDDTYVTATLRDGWYAMWWPGRIRAAVIVAVDNRNLAMGKLTPP